MPDPSLFITLSGLSAELKRENGYYTDLVYTNSDSDNYHFQFQSMRTMAQYTLVFSGTTPVETPVDGFRVMNTDEMNIKYLGSHNG